MFKKIFLEKANALQDTAEISVVLTEEHYIPQTLGVYIPQNHPHFRALMSTITRRLKDLGRESQSSTTTKPTAPFRSASAS